MQHQIEVGVGLVGVVLLIGVLARWLQVPYPILLVVGGLVLGLRDGAPDFALDPSLVLFGFLPPLLYSAAFQTEWPAFRKQLRAITLLAVGLVLFTATLVAWAAHDLVGLSWPAGFVLGAVVSPPDAVAAVAITRRLRVPKTVVTVLEGESLVNDASALVALRVAVAVAAGEAFDPGRAAAGFVAVTAVGIAVGLAGAWLVVKVHGWLGRTGLGDAKLNIALTLLTPYAVYIPAEHLGGSGVLAAVAAGLWVGNRCTRVFSRELYDEARSVWSMTEFLLNGLIFILIGLQLPHVLGRLSGDHSPEALVRAAVIIAGVVIGARLVWMFPGAYLPRWLDEKLLGEKVVYPPWQSVVVVGWTGMRGVVSLAAALAVPETIPGPPGGTAAVPFPNRDLILFLTFWVIFATLVGQGLTLPLVIRGLRVARFAEKELPMVESNDRCDPDPTPG